MEFSRPEYWSGLSFPPPGNLPNRGIKPRSPTLQANSLSQTNLPKTPSYTEGETLKAKSEGFQDHMGWFQKERLLILPENLQ